MQPWEETHVTLRLLTRVGPQKGVSVALWGRRVYGPQRNLFMWPSDQTVCVVAEGTVCDTVVMYTMMMP